MESHSSGCSPWQRRLPGLQSEHTPGSRQTVHICPSRNVPVASQVCDILPLHRADPGMHMPVQRPPEQRNAQGPPVLPQWPVASHVWGCKMLQRCAPGAQSTHTPLPRQTLAQAGLLCQLPLASQVCGTLPVQREVPGVQTPVQAPAALHTNGQAAALIVHWPAESHVCGTKPLHRCEPGVHTPQTPAPIHSAAHGGSLANVPMPPQVCGILPLHWCAPGVHIPTHIPPVQTNWHGVPVFAQCPIALQVCGCVPEHCSEPGVQSPQVPGPKQTPVHAGALCHWPSAPQVCGKLPLH